MIWHHCARGIRKIDSLVVAKAINPGSSMCIFTTVKLCYFLRSIEKNANVRSHDRREILILGVKFYIATIDQVFLLTKFGAVSLSSKEIERFDL